MIAFKQVNVDLTVLTAEGTAIAQSGSHEYCVWSVLPPATAEQGLTAKEIEAKVGKDTAKVGQGKAMRNRWIAKKGDGFLRAVRSQPGLSFVNRMLTKDREDRSTPSRT